MQENLAKLVSLLEHKLYLLNDLIAKQEKFKTFLARPDWNQLPEEIRPQEDIMVKLRQVQSAQDFLIGEVARANNVARIPNLKTLCTYVDPEWQRVILGYIDKIRDATIQLKALTQVTQALNQAEWRFNREWLSNGAAQAAPTVYNAQGFTQNTPYTYHCVSREI